MENFDANKEIKEIELWIQDTFKGFGPNAKAVIGISGGKDSTIIAKLLVNALGKDRVIGVLMPNGVQNDIDDARAVVKMLDIKPYEIDISKAFNGLLDEIAKEIKVSDDTKINMPPRLRMTTLYAVAQSCNGYVTNTCNASEEYVGYSTKFGDNAGDFSPCMEYLVTEMLEIGDALGLPYDLVHKTPSDGLCGQTDEDKLGFTYAELDHYILTNEIAEDKKKLINNLHIRNLHKVNPMPRYKRK
jgi:NAD+ synthase